MKSAIRNPQSAIPFLDYELPPHFIAQEPCAERDGSRLLVVQRHTGQLRHQVFLDLPDLLTPGDVLVLNDTQVVPARLLGRRVRTGGQWEGLFVRAFPDGSWELMCRTRGRPVPGEAIAIEPGPLSLTLLEPMPEGRWRVLPSEPAEPFQVLRRHGQVPLPPYVHREQVTSQDRERYQTVFARHPGAVAAPTAGLHFTPRLFEKLKQRGISWCFVTLHVGPGTFKPIQVEDFRQHAMHREWGELSAETAAVLAAAKAEGRRIVAVGTTAVRVLETVAAGDRLRAWSGETDLYIYPPYTFRAVDALVTNFHLPRSSLLLLVGAFAGSDVIRAAYEAAIAEHYRFFSYGDAMAIL